MVFKSLIPLCLLSVGVVHGSMGRSAALYEEINGRSDQFDYKAPIVQLPMQLSPQPHPPPAKPVPAAPRPHHHHGGEAHGTIYETLANNPRFSKVTKALDFVEDIGELLNSTDSNFTFFAPPDDVLHRPKRPEDSSFRWMSLAAWDGQSLQDHPHAFSESQDLAGAIDLIDDIDNPHLPSDPEKRKKILKFILRVILKYHIITEDGYDIFELSKNTTYPSALSFDALFAGKPLRLRVDHKVFPLSTTVNFVSKILHPNINATNGFIHAIAHPLLPPPTIFSELFLIPQAFSFFTSAIQRSNLTLLTDLEFEKGTGLIGAKVGTVFAPTNGAFQRLPKKLQFFLFSPFGAGVLKKLLQYHIVPEVAVFSDYILSTKADKEDLNYEYHDLRVHGCHSSEKPKVSLKDRVLNALGFEGTKPPIRIEPVFKKNITLETAFFNHTINAFVIQHKITALFPGPHKLGHGQKHSIYQTHVLVNHHPVRVRDLVSSNGAVHVIDRLLDPRKHHSHRPPHGHHPPHHGHGPPPPFPPPPPHHGHGPPPPPHHEHGPPPPFPPPPPHHGGHGHGPEFPLPPPHHGRSSPRGTAIAQAGDEVDHSWDDWEDWLPQWAAEN